MRGWSSKVRQSYSATHPYICTHYMITVPIKMPSQYIRKARKQLQRTSFPFRAITGPAALSSNFAVTFRGDVQRYERDSLQRLAVLFNARFLGLVLVDDLLRSDTLANGRLSLQSPRGLSSWTRSDVGETNEPLHRLALQIPCDGECNTPSTRVGSLKVGADHSCSPIILPSFPLFVPCTIIYLIYRLAWVPQHAKERMVADDHFSRHAE